MMRSRMVLGKELGTIGLSYAPVDLELALANAIAYSVETHVNRFRAFLLDSIGHDAAGGAIVCRHGGGRLWVTEFF